MRLMSDLVGETLAGRYRLVARIAGGGMGEVYRGHDLLLDRPVAVKVLQPSLAADARFVDRFRAEARAAARLTHPNVVAVYDWGREDDRTYYMVMEYVSGTDLRDVLVGRRALEPAHAVEVVAALCDALGAAHERGLVHRDVKPENVLISRTGDVKVADFGIAAVVDAERTVPGAAVAGTLRYLSPEQAAGADGTAASDLWAAGAVLAELLTGRPPHQGAGADLLRRRAVEPPVPPSKFDPGVPRQLDEVVVTACALDPTGRYEDAAEMAAALRRIGVRHLRDAPPLASLLGDLTTESVPDDLEPTTVVGRARARRMRRRPWRRRIVPAALVIALTAAAVVAGSALIGPAAVAVPDLAGLGRSAATQRAEALGLRVEIRDRVRHPEVAAGDVVSQSPRGGELTEGSTISLVVSLGPPLARVPDLVGMPAAEARGALRERRLEPGDVRRRFDSAGPGTVVAQAPESGKLEWGSEVALVVSKGPRQVAVPEVAGLKVARASGRIEAEGLVAVVVEVFSDEVAPGRVVGTTPGAGSAVDEGGSVEIMASKGPRYERLELPDVRNMSVAAARSKLTKLGLRVDVVRSCDGGDVVVDTDPIPGTTVHENDVIALFVC